MGSGSDYALSNDDVVAIDGDLFYKYHLMTKIGYRFKPISPGEVNIAVVEHDCGKYAYADVYSVLVDKDYSIGYISKHFDLSDGTDLLKQSLYLKYDFSKDAIDELLRFDNSNEDFEYSIIEQNEDDEAVNPEVIKLLPYQYSGDDIQEVAIVEYMLSNFDCTENDNEVLLPAYCRFSSEMIEGYTIKVYGNFWTFAYSLTDKEFKSERGCENPGVMYLKETDDGYVVDKFEPLSDGTDFVKDLDKVCGDNKVLRKQYQDSKSPQYSLVRSSQSRFVSDYYINNGLDIEKLNY